MNYTFTGNPSEQGVLIETKGVAIDAKAAKLNNDVKKPAVKANWEKGRVPQNTVSAATPVAKDYTSFMNGAGIVVVKFAPEVVATSTKKLRVNALVIDKARILYNAVERVEIAPVVKEEIVAPQEEIKNEAPLEPSVIDSREDIHGRHERTGEIPVEEVKEAVKESIEKPNTVVQFSTRSERNIPEVEKPEVRQENKTGDIELYNNLLHNVSSGETTEDVSRQLQGARDKLSAVKAQSQKIAEQYVQAVKELEALEQEEKEEELNITLQTISKIEDENLAKTSDLTDIRQKIAQLKAAKQAREAQLYEDKIGEAA